MRPAGSASSPRGLRGLAHLVQTFRALLPRKRAVETPDFFSAFCHAHHMEGIWSQPYRFDPERFTPGREEHKRHPFAWFPFGGGAHMCIGQHFADPQVKAVMRQVLLRFRWSVLRHYRMPYQRVPIARPRDGLPATLIRL